MYFCNSGVGIDLHLCRLVYYDSLGGRGTDYLRRMWAFLQLEHRSQTGASLDPTTFCATAMLDAPGQTTGYDCGAFVLKYCEYLSRLAPFSFSQADMPLFRRRMVYELVSGHILYP